MEYTAYNVHIIRHIIYSCTQYFAIWTLDSKVKDKAMNILKDVSSLKGTQIEAANSAFHTVNVAVVHALKLIARARS